MMSRPRLSLRPQGVLVRSLGALSRVLTWVVVLCTVGLVSAGCENQHASVAGATATASAPRTLSAEDQQAIQAQLASFAQRLGLTNPPKVAIVRVVPMSEVTPAMIKCLTSAGFPATLTADGEGWSVQYNHDQEDAYRLAAYTCAAQYPGDPAQTASRMTREQKLIAFHYLTVTLVGCLKDHGYAVTNIPSEQVFLDSWDTAPWNPYMQLPVSASTALQGTCEPNTPPKLLWGG